MPLRARTLVAIAAGLGAAGLAFWSRDALLADAAAAWIGWTEGSGLIGMAVFAVGSGVAAVLMFPGSMLMTASGAAFGLFPGFLTAQAGASLGAVLAFLVSRHAVRAPVERWAASRPRFDAVDEAIGREGWRLVLITRCCPIFPFIFQNYAYGLTRVRFSQYAWGSFLGLVPATLFFAHLGALGRAGLEAASGGAASSTPELAMTALGLVATLGAGVYATRVARRALRRAGV